MSKFLFKYYNMEPAAGRAVHVRMFNRSVYSAYWQKGFWWFRVFGRGIVCVNTRYQEPLFSYRNGFSGVKIWKLYFDWLNKRN